MSRTQTAAASLVAAIPAGVLAALLVMAFLNHAENLKLMTQLLVGGTLAVTTAVVLMPFAVLIFGGSKKSAAKASGKPAAKASGLDADDETGAIATSDEIVAYGDEEETETVVYQTDDDQDTDDLLDVDEYDDTDEDLVLSDDDVDTLDDKPPPKKRK